MAKAYWFKSDLFEINKDEDDCVNPGRYGKEPAKWLCSELKNCGYDSVELIAEDWGWRISGNYNGCSLWVDCSNVDFDDSFEDDTKTEEHPNIEDILWAVFPNVNISFFKKLFSKIDAKKIMGKLEDDLESLLTNNKQIQLCNEDGSKIT